MMLVFTASKATSLSRISPALSAASIGETFAFGS
jgi:hypothetical protein